MESIVCKIAIVTTYGSIASFMVGCAMSLPTIVAVSAVVGFTAYATALVTNVS